MKQVNFTHSGGFPLEQETLERLQTAYRSELYEALKKHLSIETNFNYIVAPATPNSRGWAIIHQDETDEDGNAAGILYPIERGTPTFFLKTTRKATNLIYGDGTSQTAYYDYEAVYADALGIPVTNNEETVVYYDLNGFKVVKDLNAIEEILALINANITAIKSNIAAVEGNIDAIETNIGAIETNIDAIEADIKQNYLPLNGSKAMEGNLSLGSHQLYLNNLSLATSNDFLSLNSANQVVKNNTIIASLIERITILESKPASAVPIGMIAIWGKTDPIPEGWEEYIPLRGRMPVGLYNPTQNERNMQFGQRAYYENLTYYLGDNGTRIWPFDQIGNVGGNVAKGLTIEEMPAHDHALPTDGGGNSTRQSIVESANSDEGISSTNRTDKTGGSKSFPLMSPYRVVQFIVYTGGTSDAAKPANLKATNISSTTLTLSWDAPTGFSNVTNYLLYKDGIQIETLGNVTTYDASGLTSGAQYNFYVIARDASGNLSGSSNTLDVTTILDTIKPSVPTDLDYSLEGNYITLSWYPSTDNIGVVRYQVYRRTSTGEVSDPYYGTPYTSGLFTGSANTTYYFAVRALDAAGNASALSSEIMVSIGSNGGSGGSGPGGCFDVESLVTMASGQSKKLKNIVVGDKLHGLTFPNEIDESEGDYMLWNGKLSEAAKAEVTVVNKTTSIQPSYYEIQTADTTIKVTGEHPLLVTEDGENVKWVSTKNVLETMFLIDKTGKTKAIESIIFKDEPLEVALLDVENVDNYIISGIAAHNDKPMDPNPVEP
ncbi:fibronectin type III domain-containing protein [Flavobacterium hungaricum]|uniref:Fibronectin type-III domain-containing protein n=1 Tax=Flavobacterium hungaricum TaxID=2082725 RepID=A0ABR9TKF7_9FLAO|nr:fibronectin type III domain-containing protein [Flavobacterium hungaricum]MBE8725785.1 hypothetical protein [Flavobacterium hungaricum]